MPKEKYFLSSSNFLSSLTDNFVHFIFWVYKIFAEFYKLTLLDIRFPGNKMFSDLEADNSQL